MGYRAVLFDWGGTLVHERPVDVMAACEAAIEALREHGVPVPPVTVLRDALAAAPIETPSIEDLLGSALDAVGVRHSARGLAAAAGEFSAAATAGLELFADARALLPSLRYRGYAAGVVTNSLFAASVLGAAAGRLGIAGYLDVIVTSADCGFAKPDPRPLLLALERLGCAPSEAIFAGDRAETDVAAAFAAGVTPVLVDRTSGRIAAPGVLRVEHLAALNALLGESLRT